MSTHVKVDIWEAEISRLKRDPSNVTQVSIMSSVLDQLKNGVDSQVGPPGNCPTVVGNYFPDPPLDIPRIADVLST